MISPVSGVSYQYSPQVSTRVSRKAVQTTQQTTQDFENLLNAIVYKQDGLTRKLVRIVGEMYQGQKLDILA
jgi:formyltetrahydrofolate synthetase